MNLRSTFLLIIIYIFSTTNLMMASKIHLSWDSNNIIDRTRYSNSGKSPVEFSDSDTVVTRHERLNGDDFPPIRIIANHSIEQSLTWKVKILTNNGFCEVGIYNPIEKIAYFIKPSRNELQSDLPGKLTIIIIIIIIKSNLIFQLQFFKLINQGDRFDTQPFGAEAFESGDIVKVQVNVYHSEVVPNERLMDIIIFKNEDNLIGTAFTGVKLCGKFYPMVGVNDEGDSIAICNN
ncbi:hypothetical protein PPL_10044 [Heterostelium album PN500]|uniref:Uncharacterized protein n=1 Tax=Heterostelium pallidum (strain ATCC 26659 / Pp 5 / PN500) TaxID=670386 RepID=D3BQ62_HETP5|nr:hypothetical protein PPL_10044 [Heterostelium album PN500]EFA76282.1 hypothetical protein PPL_10044 [Heterostelium album PN500]|eukprot:XP_020428414.1 hypothetical protein PPL_10044 [Heterostelium album PN500]